jgi:capsular polysaccharide export protein
MTPRIDAGPLKNLSGRNFLLLQGPASPMFHRLAVALRAYRAGVTVLNFCGGDLTSRPGFASRSIRAALPRLSETLERLVTQGRITDTVLFGDCRPVHQVALEVARAANLRNHVLEEGYYRPWWFTLEREGVNRHSLLPRDPAWYLRAAPHLESPAPEEHLPQRFTVRAAHDVFYRLSGVLNPMLFPAYRTHARDVAAVEYAGYVRRFMRISWGRRRDVMTIAQFLASSEAFFLFPLQLDSDVQITRHSPFPDMEVALGEVLESFARHAPAETRLLVKNHPLDYRWRSRRRSLAQRASALGVSGRVAYIESGPLAPLLNAATGVVTVNSTSGLSALACGTPVCVLGEAIYALRGLTHPGSLDTFWRHPQAPDPVLQEAFSRVVLQTTQINGGLYSRDAIDLGIRNALPWLAAEESPLSALLRRVA